MDKAQPLQIISLSTFTHHAGVTRPRKVAAIALGIATALSQQVFAQQSNPAAGPSAGTLEEVVVTAQRRAERIQDVPITITAINSAQLTQAGVKDLAGISRLTPALRFDNAGAFAQPTIRGVGSSVVTSGAGSNVGIYVDGFYIPSPLSANFQLLNIKSIDVLKGPQGTLFGHNTTGGAIQVTTKEPSRHTGGMLGVSYGNYNAQRYEGYFTTGVGDHVAIDLGGIFSKGDGYVHDVVTKSNKDGAYRNWTARLGIKVDLSDNLTALFRYQHTDTDDPSAYLDNAYLLHGVPQTAGAAYNQYPGVLPHAVYATGHNNVAYLDSTSFRAKSNAYQLTLTYDLGFATLKSYTQHRTLDAYTNNFNISMAVLNPVAGVYLPISQIGIPNENGHTNTQEFLLNSNSSGRLQWTAGAFYLDWKDPFGANLSTAANPMYVSTGRSSTETYSYAAYVNLKYQVLDNLYLQVGTRYSRDEVKDAYYHNFPDGNGGLISADLPTLKGDRWTPRAVIRYTPTANSSIYFSFSRGYKSGIYNVGGAQSKPVKPESMNAYEVGYKYAGQQLSLDLSTYYYDYKDMQVAAYTVIAGTTPASVVYNAQKARIYGLEGHVKYDFTPNFSINAGAAYTDAKYEKFLGSPTFTQCLDLVSCGAGYGFFVSGATDLHNAHMVHAPKYTANLGARYVLNLPVGDIAFSGNYYYTSKVYFDSSNAYSQNGYNLLDLRAEWTDPSGMYSLAMWGKNVTNTHYKSVLQATQAGVGNAWGAPATYGVEAKVRF